MTRLPQPGQDTGAWGDLLNDFLTVSHNHDGSIKVGAVSHGDIADKPVILASDYGWSTAAAATTNDTAFANAVAAARAAGLPLYLGTGTYTVSAALDLRATSSWGGGFELCGSSRETCDIVNTTDTAELLQVGGFNVYIHDIRIRHASNTPTGTTGDGLVFYKSAYSQFKRLQITNSGRAVSIAQSNVTEPGSSSGTGNYMFSNTFEDINVLRYSKNGLYIHGYGGRSTGSVWTNIYIQNVSPGGVPLGSTSNPVSCYLLEESTFTQLNIEDHAGVGVGMLVNSGGNIVINGLHFERVPLADYNSQYVRAYGASGIVASSVSISFSDVAAAAGSGASRLFSVAAGGRLDVRGLSLNYLTKTVSGRRYTMVEIDDSNVLNSAEVTYYLSESSIAFDAISDTTANVGLKRVGDNMYHLGGQTAQSARLYKTGADQAISGATLTQILLAGTTYTSGTYVSTATANALTATVAGLYLVSAIVRFTGGASQSRSVIIRVNSTTVGEVSATATGEIRMAGPPCTVKLNVNDVVTLQVYTAGSGVSVNGAGANDTALSLTYLGNA